MSEPVNDLLSRKMKLAEHLTCRDLLVLAASQTTSLIEAMKYETEQGILLSQSKRELDDAEAMAAVNAPGGSNETERKNSRLLAIRNDEACKTASMVVANRERDIANARMNVEQAKKQLKLTEMNIDYRIAALRMLGS